jgi:hypothetical protein
MIPINDRLRECSIRRVEREKERLDLGLHLSLRQFRWKRARLALRVLWILHSLHMGLEVSLRRRPVVL